MIRRRDLLRTIGTAAGFVRTLSGSAADRPNILWILAEDLGPQLVCYGQKSVHTPRLDALASGGVRFAHAHSTGPVCSASRSAFNVGLYQTTTGAHHHRSHRKDGYGLPFAAKLVSHRLRDAGYFTANVADIADGVKGTRKTDFNFAVEEPFQGTHWKQRAKGQPFFAQVNFQATHKGPAMAAARRMAKRIDQESIELPPYWPDHRVVRDEFGTFLDCVNLLDQQVGTLLDTMKRDGALDNTLIFFMGDNGRCLIRGKQWCYDAGTHVPLIVNGPGVPKTGSVREDPCILLDVTATTLRSAGIPLPEPFHGRPLFEGRPRDVVFTARDRCDMTVDRIRCVRDVRYAYIRNFYPERPYTQFNEYIQNEYPTLGVMKELHAQGKLNATQSLFMAARKPDVEFYDLARDPYEIHNLASDPRHHTLVTRYGAKLDEWIRSSGDRGGEPESAEAQALGN